MRTGRSYSSSPKIEIDFLMSRDIKRLRFFGGEKTNPEEVIGKVSERYALALGAKMLSAERRKATANVSAEINGLKKSVKSAIDGFLYKGEAIDRETILQKLGRIDSLSEVRERIAAPYAEKIAPLTRRVRELDAQLIEELGVQPKTEL